MRTVKLLLGAPLLAGALACDDLGVSNNNNPNRETVVKSSQDVLALISNGLIQWFGTSAGACGSCPAPALSVMADEFSTGFTDFGTQDLSREPREAVNNSVTTLSPHGGTWISYYGNVAALNTALQAISKYSLELRGSAGEDLTAQAHAFAKFTQGLNHGYVALIFDKGYIYSESVDTDTLRFTGGNQGVQNLIRPYREVMDTALAEMNAALQLASTGTFTFPGTVVNQWFLGVQTSNVQMARIIHSYMARFMVYVARNSQERAAVNWNQVIQHIDQGITSDFAVMGSVGFVESLYKQRASRQRTTTPGDFMRVDYRVVGPSDQGQGFVNWYAQPWAQRAPFRLNTADKRIDGVNSPRPSTCLQAPASASCGKYMGYHNSTVFSIERGLGQRSFYFFHRYGAGISWQSGPLPLINMAEMDLLKAEGLIRLGRAAEAVPLINKYRVTNGELPAVTVNGVPGTAPSCAPRRMDGACGSLWDALIYEKRIETMGLEGGTAYYDARGWDYLVENTPIHFPMPLRDAELLRLPTYTFGGGGTGSAPKPNFEKCPVVLPGCS
jgi:hypothetical protein